MSIDPENKGSLFGELADAYELPEADADRILANVQAAHAREVRAADSSSRFAHSVATGSGFRILLVGAACLGLAVGGATMRLAPAETPAVVASPTTPAAPPTTETIENEPMPSVSIDELPNVPAPVVGGVSAKKPIVNAPPQELSSQPVVEDTLEAETILLEGARRALKRGDASGALGLLDEHARRFPGGWLATDRAGERIIVLCGLGRRAEATREAKTFLDGRPRTPLTRRVESSCAAEHETKADQ